MIQGKLTYIQNPGSNSQEEKKRRKKTTTQRNEREEKNSEKLTSELLTKSDSRNFFFPEIPGAISREREREGKENRRAKKKNRKKTPGGSARVLPNN